MMNRPEPIRVMIVDDQAVVRSGLSAFLDIFDDLELVGEASDGDLSVGVCGKVNPDVVLMDLQMPNMNGADATAAIKSHYPHVQVVALTSFKEEELVQGVLEAGAIGYLLKNISADDLADAIRAAHAGRPTLAPEAAQALIHKTTSSGTAALGDDLTDREREVLALMTQGLNNVQIAEELIVARSTIKYHVSNILSKLHAESRTEAVAIALQNGLVETSAK